MLRSRRYCASVLLAIGAASFVHAAPPQFNLSVVKAEDVGMSTERLPRIDAAIQKWIDDHKLAGAVTLVARRGRVVHFTAQGLADIESQRPMQKDTLFHMASCS
jgi:CubicO group peptidase (beta-lactamase class C family)